MSIAQRQLDEIEALSYVLEEGCLILSNITQQPFEIEMLINTDSSQVSIIVTLSEDYPISSAPLVEVKSNGVVIEQNAAIQQHLNTSLFTTDEEVLLSLYNYIKDEIVVLKIDSVSNEDVHANEIDQNEAKVASVVVAKGEKASSNEIATCAAAISNLDFGVKSAADHGQQHTNQHIQQHIQQQKQRFHKEDFFWSTSSSTASIDYQRIFSQRKFEYKPNPSNDKDFYEDLTEEDLIWKLENQFQMFSVSASINNSIKDYKNHHNGKPVEYTAYCFPLFNDVEHFYSNNKRAFLFEQFKQLKQDKEAQMAAILTSKSAQTDIDTKATSIPSLIQVQQLANEIKAMSDPMAQIVEILTCLYALDSGVLHSDNNKRDWEMKRSMMFYYQYANELKETKSSQKNIAKVAKHEKKGKKCDSATSSNLDGDSHNVMKPPTGMICGFDEGVEKGSGDAMIDAVKLFQKSDFLVVIIAKFEESHCQCHQYISQRVDHSRVLTRLTADVLKEAKYSFLG